MKYVLFTGLLLALGAEPESIKVIGLIMMLIALPYIKHEPLERNME